MIDPQEALSDLPEGSAVCGVCDGSLPAARYVHVEARSAVVLCSADCFREIAREHRRLRWAERRRHMAQASLVIILGSVFVTPHGGPPGHWRLAHAAPAP